MTKTILNKKRIKKNLILRIFFSFSILMLLLLVSYKYVYNIIESFSENYNYIFNNIEIRGLKNIPPNQIEKYFVNYYNKSIFLLPLKDISYEIKKNKWIKSASLKSDFRNKIIVNIEESRPIGVYFNGINYLLIDDFGEVIDFVDEKNSFQYIKFLGENAKINIVDLIKNIPLSLKVSIKEAEYINTRRWNITLKNNTIIKLPEIETKEALLQFIEIYDSIPAHDKSIIDSFDLRIPNKAIIQYKE